MRRAAGFSLRGLANAHEALNSLEEPRGLQARGSLMLRTTGAEKPVSLSYLRRFAVRLGTGPSLVM